MTDRSLFNIIGDTADGEEELVIPKVGLQKPAVDSVLETPKPGFCVKTRTESGTKVFINICTSDKIGQPPDINGDELQEIIQSEDVSRFRVPMSVGPPHGEMDKSGAACTSYDVVIHPDFCAKVQREDIFLQFLLSATLLLLEQKYDIKPLHEACIILKNKRHHGRLEPQLMRLTKKPFVVEMDAPSSKVMEIQKTKLLPCTHIITVEPKEGRPEFIVVDVTSHLMKRSNGLQLDVGEDRIELVVRPGDYRLDLDLPHWVHPERGGAQFDCNTSTLTLTLPVQEGEG